MAVLREIAAVQFFGAKFQKFFGCVSGIRFAVSFGVRLHCRDFLQYAQAVITTKEKEPCTPGHCRWMDTILFRYKNVFKSWRTPFSQ